ncbi:nickel pincer cofactor biosynthesis protein LarC [Arthrobacter sp. zg-Y769]|uniref:nickel pincer cofactor biosynthesis protein LarC n=1 Tax=Arthrobacter sp. zg-Y769 TaxID=2894191 RepID=UPI001E5B4C13|nr:nickel pincer cofactor biosynthesis protein LarC [Arthrobacter sp. zg-Y769]MCC9204269.1 nickel pincer cofactor biosynthesis protein LarC [Arthrobacter sp. zg-Y769]
MILFLNPIAGLSGDMLLGALVDLGAPLESIRASIEATGITGWRLTAESVERQGVRATHAVVEVDDVVPARAAADLLKMASLATPPEVAAMAVAAINSLAEVESRIHGVPAASVHLHELGGVDTIVDTVGVAAALQALDISEVWSGPVGLGTGQVKAAHGLLPVPAPATLALLKNVPVVGIDTTTETVTPTGAALLRAMNARFGPMPAMTIRDTGYGAGTRDTPGRPNVVTAVLGTPALNTAHTQSMTMLETTVDDVTGEVLGHLINELLEAGAADAWIAPVVGKKNRPAHVISALCLHQSVPSVEERLLKSTGTLGVRHTLVDRRALPREWSKVDVEGSSVRIKIGPHRVKPEHADLVAASEATGIPLRVLADRIIDQFRAEASQNR